MKPIQIYWCGGCVGISGVHGGSNPFPNPNLHWNLSLTPSRPYLAVIHEVLGLHAERRFVLHGGTMVEEGGS
jgi:hypothetical protein